MHHDSTTHQQNQIKVINELENQVITSTQSFSSVAPVDDYEADTRMCLTSVHLPHQNLLDQIQANIINPLKMLEPDFYFYTRDNLHMTIKNIRIVSDPPNFSDKDVEIVKKIFSSVVPSHKKFQVHFYRLLLFRNSLALIGTTDPELDEIFLDLDSQIKEAGVHPDDKIYINKKYFFSNMTLVRFNKEPSDDFVQKVNDLSNSIHFAPYSVDSICLLTCTAMLKRRTIIGYWKLN